MTPKLTKILITSANTILLALLLFTAYGGKISPAISALPSIAAMTFPIFLILTVIATVLYLFFNPTLAVINIIAMIICGGPILSYCPLNIAKAFSAAPSDECSFTLMNYNVTNLSDYTILERNKRKADQGNDDDKEDPDNGATLRYILACAPDIVAMQECFDYSLNDTETKFPALADSINKLYPHIYSTPNKAITLMSRFPFEPIDLNINLSETNHFEFQAYRMDIEGHSTYLISVHMQSIGLSPDDKQLYLELTKGEARTKDELKEVRNDILSKLAHAYKMRAIQAEEIRQAVDSLKGNIIVCGDFNDIPDSYAVRTICGDDLHSAFREAGCGPGISFHADRFYFRIDHCLYRGDMTPVKSYIPHNPTSDHFPLITTFVWDNCR